MCTNPQFIYYCKYLLIIILIILIFEFNQIVEVYNYLVNCC